MKKLYLILSLGLLALLIPAFNCKNKTDYGLFVAVGDDGTVATSNDGGFSWNRSSPCHDDQLHDIVYGNGIYLATGADSGGSGVRAWYSTDGTNWLETYPDNTQNAVTIFGNGLFVLISTGGVVKTSTDCVTWTTEASTLTSVEPIDAIYANNTFYVVCSNDPNKLVVYTSTDASSWTPTVTTLDFTGGAICYAAGTFVLATSTGYFYTSSNATSWDSGQQPGGSVDFRALAYGNGTFVASGVSQKIWISEDMGYSWQQSTPNLLPSMEGLTYGANHFVLVGGYYDIWISSSGKLGTWSEVYSTTITNYLMDVVYVE